MRCSRSPAPARTSRGGSPSSTASSCRPQTWERDLAHARTFCFYEEIEFLIKNGLIKGGSLENAVVIRDDAVLTDRAAAVPGRVRPAQDAGHRGGPVAAGPAAARALDRRQAQPRGELRAGPADPGANAQAAGGRAGFRPAPGCAQGRHRCRKPRPTNRRRRMGPWTSRV